MGTLTAALFIQHKSGFWILGSVIGIVLGGTQSVSRALMSSMTPRHQSAQFFGFFNLTGKATSFLGTFLFGLIVAFGAGTRVAIFSILPFFLVGALLILFVNIRQGVGQRHLAESRDHQ
jgi:UMF1 family MFS transporter